MPDRHVVPNPRGGWDIKEPGARRSSGNYATQSEAIQRAKEIVGDAGGGEIHIHRPEETIRSG